MILPYHFAIIMITFFDSQTNLFISIKKGTADLKYDTTFEYHFTHQVKHTKQIYYNNKRKER